MVIFIVLFVIMIALIWGASNIKTGSHKDKGFKEALDVYNNHLYTEAMKKFQLLLNEEPFNSIYHWYVSLCALQRQDYTTAIYHIENVLQINNFSIPVDGLADTENFHEIGIHQKLMEIYETLRLKDKVLTEYETLMKLSPKEDIYPLKIAQYYIDEKNYSDLPQSYLEKALSINPKNANAQFLLSLIYYKKNEFDNALQSAEKTITLDKSLNDAYYIMGYSRYRANLKDEAEKLFRDAALSRYFKKSASFYTAKLLASNGKLDYALTYAADASKIASSVHEDPTIELDAKYLYGNLLEQTDHFEQAKEVYQFIQNVQPDFRDIDKRLKYMAPLKPVNDQKIDMDLLDIFKKLKNDDFAEKSEKVLEIMGFKIKKIDLINDMAINMLAQPTTENTTQLVGVFIRRGIPIIQEDHIKSMEHIMTGMQVFRGILITPNDFNPNSRKMAEKKGIKTINGEQLSVLLNQVMK